ncbi:type II toxin-antitoxin system HipA family toxin [Leucobacter iarius]|uniref:HipA domain-containing protein n=1 Tax=Leucobacter iarius TaxID=333963 RepID=A0ABN2L7X4_9MICO
MRLHDALEVHVEIDGAVRLAGRLEARFAGGRTLASTSFSYEPTYLADPSSYQIDPRLPWSRAPIISGEDIRLFGAIRDLTPDSWGRQLINADLAVARREGSSIPRPVGDFDYLALTSDETRLGALRFRPVGVGPWLGEVGRADTLTERSIDRLAIAAARFETHDATDEDLELLRAPGSTMGGARPKATIRFEGRLALVKFPSDRDGRYDGEAWEMVALRLAERAGIDAQCGRLMRTVGGKSTLVLTRFDRTATGSRVGYMSAATAMELNDGDHSGVTYEDLADAVDRHTGGDRSQLRELFKRVALTVLVNNVDDHWRNHGFLRVHGGWRLSPAFDINPSMSRGTVSSRPISDEDDPRDRDIRLLAKTADTYGLSRTQAAEALSEVLGAVGDWAPVAKEIGLSSSEIAEMSVAFSEEQQERAREAITTLGGGPLRIDMTGAAAPAPVTELSAPESGVVWVAPHSRGGRRVPGFWRRRPASAAKPEREDD